jgi:hypothetical protein
MNIILYQNMMKQEKKNTHICRSHTNKKVNNNNYLPISLLL